MRALLLLVVAGLLPLRGQAPRVMFQPVSLGVSDLALGRSGLGAWTVSVILPPGTSATRQAILMAAPEVRALPNRAAQAILARGAYQDKRSTAARVVGALVEFAPMGLGIAGVVTGSTGYSWGGLAVSGGKKAYESLKTRAPDISLLTPDDLLPDVITRTGTWYVFASLVHGAAQIGPLQVTP